MNETSDSGAGESDKRNDVDQAPEEHSVQPGGDDLLSVFAGPKNTRYFMHAFRRFVAGGSVKWNWPAFFATWSWLLYRKMWLYSLVYIIGVLVLIVVLIFVALGVGGGPSALISSLTYGFIVFVVAPMFATRLYYTHAGKKISNIKSRTPDIEEQRQAVVRAGGTSVFSTIAAVLLPLTVCYFLFVLVMLIGHESDTTVRAQVSEGLNLAGGVKASIVEHYYLTWQLPSDNAAAGVSPAAQISGRFVSSVRIESGDVIVTYGNDADSDISGHTLVIRSVVSDHVVTFECSSVDIAEKHLPAACRVLID